MQIENACLVTIPQAFTTSNSQNLMSKWNPAYGNYPY